MTNTPPTHVFDSSSATASVDPKDTSIVQLTFHTSDGWYHFRVTRQLAMVVESQIGAALGRGEGGDFSRR
jgi:hypothetical protein